MFTRGIFATAAGACTDFMQKWLLTPYGYNVISAQDGEAC